MAEIPEHVKAEANAQVEATGLQEKFPVKDMGTNNMADAYDTKGVEAQRQQQRETALEQKAPEPER